VFVCVCVCVCEREREREKEVFIKMCFFSSSGHAFTYTHLWTDSIKISKLQVNFSREITEIIYLKS